MDIEDYKRQFSNESSPGWEAIDESLRNVYGDQEPMHWGTIIKHMLGGPDPLDGISAYSCGASGVDHLHFVTYGYSSLYYDEESVGGDFSRFGFEMTFRLASPLPPDEQPIWVCNLLQNLAKYVFESGRWFEEYHWIPANGPIRADFDTDVVGLVFTLDSTILPVTSPHGRVEFLQAFGVTQLELDALKAKTKTCQELIEHHRKSNPLLVTDISRRDCP